MQLDQRVELFLALGTDLQVLGDRTQIGRHFPVRSRSRNWSQSISSGALAMTTRNNSAKRSLFITPFDVSRPTDLTPLSASGERHRRNASCGGPPLGAA